MWGWYTKNNEPVPPRTITLEDGREITQDALADSLSSKLGSVRWLMFTSAAGTGKTLIATEAMVRVVIDNLEDGKFLLFLTPYKHLQKSVFAMFNKFQYKLIDGKLLKPVMLFGRSEFKCPFWIAHSKYNTADKCVRQECTLYLPPVRSKPDITGIVRVARWGSWFLYGVKKEEIKYTVTNTEKTALLDNAVIIHDAALCPYFAQYAELDVDIEDPKIIILNYDKFLKDYMLGRIEPSMIAGVIIDEADKFFSRFAPQPLNVEDLKLLRRAIKKQAEHFGDKLLMKAVEELETAIATLESSDTSTTNLLESLDRFVRLLFESENVEESLINDVTSFLSLLPSRLVEYSVIKVSPGEALIAPIKLRFLEEFSDIPILGISATMDYVSYRALNLHDKFTIEFGQQRSPGMVVLWLLKNAEPLVGWHIRRKVTNQLRFRSLVQQALEKEILSYLDSLSIINKRIISVGFSFATIYAQIMEQVGAGKVYADIVGRSLDRAITELASGKLVVSTRFMRGVNLLDMIEANTKTILAFIPKYPRQPPDSPEHKYYNELLSRGAVFPGYMLSRISHRGYLADNWDISTEKSLADLYQAIGRGLRGEDYTVIIASTDIEVYGAVAALADAGFINKPLLAYDFSVYEPTEREWRYLQDIFFNKYNAKLMKEKYEALLNALLDKGEAESKYRLIDIPAISRAGSA